MHYPYAPRKKTKHIPNHLCGYNTLSDPTVNWILNKQLVRHSFSSRGQMWCQFRLWMQILLLHLLRQSNMIATLLLKWMMKQKSQTMVKTHWKSVQKNSNRKDISQSKRKTSGIMTCLPNLNLDQFELEIPKMIHHLSSSIANNFSSHFSISSSLSWRRFRSHLTRTEQVTNQVFFD